VKNKEYYCIEPNCYSKTSKENNRCKSCSKKSFWKDRKIKVSEEILKQKYITEKKPLVQVAKEMNLLPNFVYNKLKKLGCIRTISQAAKIGVLKHKKDCNCFVCKAKKGAYEGEGNPMFGVRPSQKSIDYLIAFNKSKKSKPLTKEHKDNISKGNKGKERNEQQKKNISDGCKGRVAWNKNIKNSTSKYWLGKSNKYIIITHHIDGNHNNNAPENLMKIRQDLHRSLHWRGYNYLVSIGIVRKYIREYMMKCSLSFSTNSDKTEHHIDGNRNNNSEDNLMCIANKKIHDKLHQEAYLYLVKINKIKEYIDWFLSKERQKVQSW
jgi:hypothetical protein